MANSANSTISHSSSKLTGSAPFVTVAPEVPGPSRWSFERTWGTALIFSAILIRLFFWFYTGRVWEDALITVLHSENAARGLGLTHLQVDSRPLQGFTSPLSVLIPLAGDFLHVGFGLTLIKIVSALCGGVGVWLGIRICRLLQLCSPLTFAVGAVLAFEHHQILWGMAGMETQIVVAVYLFAGLCWLEKSDLYKGISLGLCMLARPDAAIWVAILLAFETWRNWRMHRLRPLLIICTSAICVYGPWLLFTTWYYGSPVPNTISAKSLGYAALLPFAQHLSLTAEILLLLRRFLGTFITLGPTYGGNGTGFHPFADYHAISIAVTLCGAAGLAVAIRRRDWRVLPFFAFSIAYALYFTFLVPIVFGWYRVPVAAMALLCAAYGANVLLQRLKDARTRGRVALAASLAYVFSIVAVLPITFPAERKVQIFVEDQGRKQIGLYLAGVMRPGQTIGVECLGYIGYYSRHIAHDFPGLCSREVVKFFCTHPQQRSLVGMLEGLRPDYIVLRPGEYSPNINGDWLIKNYTLVRSFRVSEAHAHQLFDYQHNQDLAFDVFRKKTAGAEGSCPLSQRS